MFRVTHGETGFDADTLDQVRDRLRREEPGLYHVDEIRAEPSPTAIRRGLGVDRFVMVIGELRMSRILGQTESTALS